MNRRLQQSKISLSRILPVNLDNIFRTTLLFYAHFVDFFGSFCDLRSLKYSSFSSTITYHVTYVSQTSAPITKQAKMKAFFGKTVGFPHV